MINSWRKKGFEIVVKMLKITIVKIRRKLLRRFKVENKWFLIALKDKKLLKKFEKINVNDFVEVKYNRKRFVKALKVIKE